MTDTPNEGATLPTVDSVIITDELKHRPSRQPDYAAENRAQVALAQELADNPGGALQKIAELVLQLCHADSAGISILESEDGQEIFRWHAAAGAFAPSLHGTMSRDNSPCGLVLDRNMVLLFDRAGRFFPALSDVEPPIYENLLAPWEVNGRAAGTVWAVNHSPEKRFDAEDARLLRSFGQFAGLAYSLIEQRQETKQAHLETQQAHIAERESEEKYRTLFNSMAQGFCIIEIIFDDGGKAVDYRFLEVNAAFAQQTGIENAAGKSIREFDPQLEDFWCEIYGRIVTTGEPVRFSNRTRHFNRWFDVYAFRLGEPEQNRVAIVFDNITARKLSEEKQAFLLRLTDALRSLRSSDAVKATAARLLGQHLGVNRAFYCEIEGNDWVFVGNYENGVSPMPVGRYAASTYGNWVMETYRAGQNIVFRDTQTAPRFAPSEREAHAAIQVLGALGIPLVKHDQLVAILALHTATPRDWTEAEIDLVEEVAQRTWAAVERAHAEEQLRQSEAKYRTLFDSIDEGFCLIELIDDEHGQAVDYRFLNVNQVFERQTGLQNVVGKRLREVAPATEPHWLQAHDRAARTGQPQRLENYNEATQRWYLAYSSRVGGEGSRQIAIVFDDVTERKRRELNATFLDLITNDLAVLSSPNEMMQTVGAHIGRFLQASSCVLKEVDEAGSEVTVVYAWMKPDLPGLKTTYHLADYLTAEFNRAARAGELFVVRDTQRDERVNAQNYAECHIGAFVVVPFHWQGRWTAYISVTSEAPRDWRDDEVELLQEVSNRLFSRLERARAEEELRRSEEKYRHLFDSMDEGYCIIQMIYDEAGRAVDWRFLQVNRAFELNNGLHNAQGKTIREMAPAIEPKWMEIYDQVAQTGHPLRFEESSAALDRAFDLYAFPIGAPEERKVAVLFTDVTQRKREERWQAYLLKLSDALRPLSDAVEIQRTATQILGEHLQVDSALYAEISDDGQTLQIGDHFVRNGFPPIVGQFPVRQFGEPMERLRRGETLVLSDVGQTPSMTDAEKAATTSFNVWATVTVPLIKGGRWVSNLGVHQRQPRQWTPEEIALLQETAERTWAAVERARAEAALRDSQERFESLANLVSDLLWDSEPDGSTTWYNQRWLEYSGKTFEESLGWGWVDTIHPDDREASARRYREAVESGQPLRQEHRIRRYEGEYRWFAVNSAPLKDQNGQVIKMYGAATDIHEQRLALQSLQRARDELEARVQERTAQLRREIAQRQEAERAREQLLQRVVTAQEEERRRISLEMHDQMGQLLTALLMGLNALPGVQELQPHPQLPIYEQRVEKLKETAQEVMEQMHRLAWELRPSVLDNFGLVPALRQYVEEWGQRNLIQADFLVRGIAQSTLSAAARLPAEIETTLYRVVQEALTNVQRHANASQVGVVIERRGTEALAIIEDNGQGFEVEEDENGTPRPIANRLGLLGMVERAELVGGSLTIESTPGQGTTVYARVPLNRDQDDTSSLSSK